jgi:integrase
MPWLEMSLYARVCWAADEEGWPWNVAVRLGGEAAARVGEIQEVRWREDVDLVGLTLIIQRKNSDGRIEATKGREKRVVPMTSALEEVLRKVSRIREGLLVSHRDGSALTRKEMETGLARVYRRAGVQASGAHVLRHTFGTHAAMLGANSWRLQAWMGHKSITTTLMYVHVVEAHPRPIPAHVLQAGEGVADPDRRVVAMLGVRGNHVPTEEARAEETRTIS